MSKKLKGRLVKVIFNGKTIAKSTSCTVSLKTNTTEAASKDDEDSMFDSPEIVSVGWDVKNESFVVDRSQLANLLNAWVRAEALDVTVDGDDAFSMAGKAYISSLSISADVKDYAKLSLSLTGNGPLHG